MCRAYKRSESTKTHAMHHCHLGKNPSECSKTKFSSSFSDISDLFESLGDYLPVALKLSEIFHGGIFLENLLGKCFTFYLLKKLWCYLPSRRYTINSTTIDVFDLNLIGISPKIHDVYPDFHWSFSELDQSHCTYLKCVCPLHVLK